MKKTFFYFAYIGVEGDSASDLMERLNYIFDQLRFIKNTEGFEEFNNKFIVYTAPKYLWELIDVYSSELSFGVYKKYCGNKNLFEYPGFISMKDYSSLLDDDDLIFYSHSKGVFNKGLIQTGIFKFNIVLNFKNKLLNQLSDVYFNKAGLFPTVSGTFWYNFFWIKAKFISKLDVDVNNNRYKFEQLIKDKKNSTGLSLLDEDFRKNIGFLNQNEFSSHELNQNDVLRELYKQIGTKSNEDINYDLIYSMTSEINKKYKFSNFLFVSDGRRVFFFDGRLVLKEKKSSERGLQIVRCEFKSVNEIVFYVFSGRKLYLNFENEKIFLDDKSKTVFLAEKGNSNLFSMKFNQMFLSLDDPEYLVLSNDKNEIFTIIE